MDQINGDNGWMHSKDFIPVEYIKNQIQEYYIALDDAPDFMKKNLYYSANVLFYLLDKWDAENGWRKKVNYEYEYKSLVQSIGSATYGKERWFLQDNGKWYDRKECDYITIDVLEQRIRSAIFEMENDE